MRSLQLRCHPTEAQIHLETPAAAKPEEKKAASDSFPVAMDHPGDWRDDDQEHDGDGFGEEGNWVDEDD